MKNERIQPIVFAECGCRLDLTGKKSYEGTLCKFHEKEIQRKLMNQIIFGDPDIELGK